MDDQTINDLGRFASSRLRAVVSSEGGTGLP
jgi:hypothetical protein